jgi:hypothetical protein
LRVEGKEGKKKGKIEIKYKPGSAFELGGG